MLHGTTEEEIIACLRKWLRTKSQGPRIEERRLEIKLENLVKLYDTRYSSAGRG